MTSTLEHVTPSTLTPEDFDVTVVSVNQPEAQLAPEVKRVRVAEEAGKIVLGLNNHAAKGIFNSVEFWQSMRERGQKPVELLPEEMVDGLFSDKQIVLVPQDGSETLGDESLKEFAEGLVTGKIVPEWAQGDPATRGVIVSDDRTSRPFHEFDTPESTVLASSLDRYLPFDKRNN